MSKSLHKHTQPHFSKIKHDQVASRSIVCLPSIHRNQGVRPVARKQYTQSVNQGIEGGLEGEDRARKKYINDLKRRKITPNPLNGTRTIGIGRDPIVYEVKLLHQTMLSVYNASDARQVSSNPVCKSRWCENEKDAKRLMKQYKEELSRIHFREQSGLFKSFSSKTRTISLLNEKYRPDASRHDSFLMRLNRSKSSLIEGISCCKKMLAE